MQIEEANRIIAEFMGNKYNPKGHFEQTPFGPHYHEKTNYLSLDALVPVWERLGVRTGRFNWKFTDRSQVGFYIRPDDLHEGCHGLGGETIQEAACIATAKAIKELGNE